MAKAKAGAGIFDDSSARVDVFHCREALVISFIERQVDVLRGSYHFNDKSRAVLGHLMCIMPKVGKKNLSFFCWEFNEILNEIAVANYDNFHYLLAKI